MTEDNDGEKILIIPLEELHTFKDHPFRVVLQQAVLAMKLTCEK